MTLAAFDVTRYRGLLTTESFGREIIFESSTGSTMDVARGAAKQGAPEGTIAVADEQTSGRGRLGRSWVTPPRANLASTLIMHPNLDHTRQISMIAPLAVCDAIEADCGIVADIKWPNDVHIAGRKLAGVLIESTLEPGPPLVLVGTGINVNFDPAEHAEIRDIATSLLRETGHLHDRESVLAAYVANFERMYLESARGVSMMPRWKNRLVTLGQHVHASWPGGEATGLAEDVDDDGGLIVRIASDATITVQAGDVTLRQ